MSTCQGSGQTVEAVPYNAKGRDMHLATCPICGGETRRQGRASGRVALPVHDEATPGERMTATTARFATRVKFHDARRHFENGGTVLISENGTEAEVLVSELSTVHTRETTTWEYLAEQVRMWRSRYPNQRFYIVDDEVPEPEPQVSCAEHGPECPYGCIRA